MNNIIIYDKTTNNPTIIVLDNSGFALTQPQLTIWFTDVVNNYHTTSLIVNLTNYAELNGNANGLAINNEHSTLYVTSLSGGVYAITISNGNIIRLDVPGALIGTTDIIVDSNDNLYVTDCDSGYHPGKPLQRGGAVFYLKLNS